MEKEIWNFLKQAGLNDYACAGLMGNLFAESGLNPKNLEDTYNKKLEIANQKNELLVKEVNDFFQSVVNNKKQRFI